MLLAILACCTLGRCDNLAGCSVKASAGFGLAQDAGAHEELDLAEVHVPKSVVPTKQLFFWLGEVDVGGVDSGDGNNESFDSNWSVFEGGASEVGRLFSGLIRATNSPRVKSPGTPLRTN